MLFTVLVCVGNDSLSTNLGLWFRFLHICSATDVNFAPNLGPKSCTEFACFNENNYVGVFRNHQFMARLVH